MCGQAKTNVTSWREKAVWDQVGLSVKKPGQVKDSPPRFRGDHRETSWLCSPEDLSPNLNLRRRRTRERRTWIFKFNFEEQPLWLSLMRLPGT